MTLPAALLPWIERRFFLPTGVVNNGGTVQSYAAGTTTPLPTYSDSGLTVPNTNPIVLDGGGQAPNPIFLLPQAYKFVVSDSAANVLYTFDHVSDPAYTFMSLLGQMLGMGSKSVTTGYDIVPSDFLVTVNEPTTDPAIINLPASADRGGILFIQNAGPTTVAITPNGIETINTASGPFTLPAQSGSSYPTAMILPGTSGYYVVAGWGLS